MKTKKRGNETKAEGPLEYANSIIDTLREPFLVLNNNLRVILANRSFYTTFKVTEKDTIGRLLPELGNKQLNIPGLLQLLKEIIPEKKLVKDYKVEQTGKQAMIINARHLRVPKKIAEVAKEEELILVGIEDVTERERMKSMLQTNEQKMRAIFDQTFQFIGLMTTDGILIEANRTALEFSGVDASAVLNKPFWETPWWIHSPELQEKLRQSITRVANGEFIRFDATHLAKDGILHYIDFSLKPVRDKTGKVIYIIPEGRDITEHKQMEIELEKHRDHLEELIKEKTRETAEARLRFETIFEDMRDGMLVADIDTKKFIMCNKALSGMLGYTKEEIRRLSVNDIHPEKDLPQVIEIFRDQARGEIKLAENIPVQRKDGGVFYADINTSIVTLDGKKCLMGSFRDITERKIAEERLRESEESYRTIFESANDAIVIRDINTYKILDANEKACEMTCYTKDEIIGLPLESLSANNTQYSTEKLKLYYEKASKGEPQFFEWLNKDKFGREFWVEINVKRAIIGGRYSLIYIARDITERRQLLDERNKFINTISHELRTPLVTVKESISLISEHKAKHIDKKDKKMIDIAKRNIDKLTRLIGKIMDIQSIDAGMMEFELDENDINKTIKDAHREMISLAENKGLGFTLRLDKNLPRVRFDSDKILEVLINLVNNAIAFTKKGNITITTAKGKNFIRISVKDTGAGIKKKDLDKVFQRFSQLKRKPDGTGLGLAICKEIIEKHGGKIEAVSEYGKGTTVSFVLPIRERRG